MSCKRYARATATKWLTMRLRARAGAAGAASPARNATQQSSPANGSTTRAIGSSSCAPSATWSSSARWRARPMRCSCRRRRSACSCRRPRLALTREGQVLYDLVRPLVEGIENLDQQFRTLRGGLDAGEVNIAAGASTIQYLLPPLVRAYRERHPDVRLQLANVTGKDGLALLRSDQVDFAFGSMLDVPHDLSYEPVHWFDPMLILPLDHPLAANSEIVLQDLSPYGLILPPQRLTTYRLVDLVFQQRKVPYRVAIEVGGWEVIKEYVAMGLGISIVTGICIKPEDQQLLAVRNMRRYFPQRSYGVVARKGKYLSAQARAFVDLIKPGLFARRDYYETGHSER